MAEIAYASKFFQAFIIFGKIALLQKLKFSMQNLRQMKFSAHVNCDLDPISKWAESRNYKQIRRANILPPNGILISLDTVPSTMDVAREIASLKMDSNQLEPFAVSAANQIKGRGTNGRSWVGSKGNVFLTIGLPYESLSIPMTLVPLRIGTIVANALKPTIENSDLIRLKWPNDVLVEGKKVSGVLIESCVKYMLIGVGINLENFPEKELLQGKENGSKSPPSLR